MQHNRRMFLAASAAGLAGVALGGRAIGASPATAATRETVLNGTFASYGTLESAWNYLYPWGSDHNGTARMFASPSDRSQVYLESGGVLVIKATPTTKGEGNSSKDPYLPIHYHSGAIHAKQKITVTAQYPGWEVRGDFQAPSARGTWPAFWLTGADSWPPESDILEFKGDGRNWSNTYKNASGAWSNTTVNVSNPGGWHTYRAVITKVNGSDVDIEYFVDGKSIAKHRGANFVGKAMWLIINLQMEGSAGSPGPTGATFYRARNIYVGRDRA